MPAVFLLLPALTLADPGGADPGRAVWPNFRGPTGDGVAPASYSPPAEWDGERGTNVRWRVDLPGPGSSQPVVWGDAVFVTCFTGYGTGDAMAGDEPGSPADLVFHLLKLDLSTGEVLWDKPIPATAPEDPYRGFIGEHGYATSTPVADAGRVYCVFGKTGVLAFDHGGEEVWRTNVGTESGPRGWGSGASPALATGLPTPGGGTRDLLFVNACEQSQSLVALDPATGEEVWRAEAKLIEQTWATPVLAAPAAGAAGRDARELLFAIPEELWGVDPASGAVKWYATVPVDGSACPTPVVADGVAYVVGGRRGGSAAVRLGGGGAEAGGGGTGEGTGGGDVTDAAVLWETNEGSYVPSPVLIGVGGAARLLTLSDRGVATSQDAETGEVIFQDRLPTAGLTPFPGGRGGGASFYASPVVAGGRVYATTRAGDTFVIEPADDLEVLAVNKLGPAAGRCNAAPAVTPDALVLRTDRGVWCLAAE